MNDNTIGEPFEVVRNLLAEAEAARVQYNPQNLKAEEQNSELLAWLQKPLLLAADRYQKALELDQCNAELWQKLGNLYFELKDYDRAVPAIQTALELEPGQPVRHYNLGFILEKAGKVDLAIVAYQAAIQHYADFFQAYERLGHLFRQKQNYEQAVWAYQQVIAIAPQITMGYLGLGQLYLEVNQLEAALAILQQAQQINPWDANCLHQQGLVYQAKEDEATAAFYLSWAASLQGDYDAAIAHYRKVLQLKPENAQVSLDIYQNLATAYQETSQIERAIEVYREALRIYPDNETLRFTLISTLQLSGYTQEAVQNAQDAAQQFPTRLDWQFEQWRIFPILYQRSNELPDYRARFQRGLDLLNQAMNWTEPERRQQALNILRRQTNFFLHYQNDPGDTALQSQYGQFVHQTMSREYPAWAKPLLMPSIKATGRIRVGYCSAYFKQHTIGKLYLGWLKYANREAFEVFCYHLDNDADYMTEQFRFYSDQFRHLPRTIETVAQQIRTDDLHVLVYPEIGMDALTLQLAGLRLAPVQCMAWGHPVTSGLPTIDYFLSSDLMEPEGAEQTDYTETLIRLPGTSVAYIRPDIPPPIKTRQDFGLREDSVVYLCNQSLFKYLPNWDHLLAQIAQQVSNAEFVFISYRMGVEVDRQLQKRLQQAFLGCGLDAKTHCVIVPRQSQVGFWNLNQVSDVFLDSPGWSGGNTTFDAIACGLPVVTYPGSLMRGRHAAAILHAMGITETIATNPEAYIQTAVRLGLDTNYRAELREKIQHCSSHLFDDKSCVMALEDFYRRVVTQG